MAFIPAPQVAQVAVIHLLDDEEVINILNFAIGAPVNATNLAALADAVLQAWGNDMMPNLSNDLTLTEVRARDLTTQDGLQVAVNPVSPVAGGATGDCCPANVALVITHRTAFIGRSRRGRTYISGVPESVTTLNNVTALWAGAVESAFRDVVEAAEAAGWLFGVLSRFANGVSRETALFTQATLSLVRNTRVDSQRGRLPD